MISGFTGTRSALHYVYPTLSVAVRWNFLNTPKYAHIGTWFKTFFWNFRGGLKPPHSPINAPLTKALGSIGFRFEHFRNKPFRSINTWRVVAGLLRVFLVNRRKIKTFRVYSFTIWHVEPIRSLVDRRPTDVRVDGKKSAYEIISRARFSNTCLPHNLDATMPRRFWVFHRFTVGSWISTCLSARTWLPIFESRLKKVLIYFYCSRQMFTRSKSDLHDVRQSPKLRTVFSDASHCRHYHDRTLNVSMACRRSEFSLLAISSRPMLAHPISHCLIALKNCLWFMSPNVLSFFISSSSICLKWYRYVSTNDQQIVFPFLLLPRLVSFFLCFFLDYIIWFSPSNRRS